MKRTLVAGLATAAVLSGGFGLTMGTAHADPVGPFKWCPGDDLPEGNVVWNMGVCHTYFYVARGLGNVARDDPESVAIGNVVWDGPNPPTGPPPPPPPPAMCGPFPCAGLLP